MDALYRQGKPEAKPLLNSMLQKAAEKDKPALILRLAELDRRLSNFADAATRYRKLFVKYPASVEGLQAAEAIAWMVFHGKMSADDVFGAGGIGTGQRVGCQEAGSISRERLITRCRSSNPLIKGSKSRSVAVCTRIAKTSKRSQCSRRCSRDKSRTKTVWRPCISSALCIGGSNGTRTLSFARMR